jgi:hypothetical protein
MTYKTHLKIWILIDNIGIMGYKSGTNMLIMRLAGSASKSPSFVRNLKYPACANCAHFINDTISVIYSRCKMFGEMDLVSGKIKYDFADFSRGPNQPCGITGKLFQKKVDEAVS